MAKSEPNLDVAKETLSGDVRDHIMEFLKHNKSETPYNRMTEDQQRDLADRAEKFAFKLVENAVSAVAANGHQSMRFSLKGIQQTTKGNITLKLETPFTSDTWAILGNSSTVEVISADAHEFEGERQGKEAHVAKDQSSLLEHDEPVMDQTPAGKGTGKGKGKNEKADKNTKAPEPKYIKNGVPTEDGYNALARAVEQHIQDNTTENEDTGVETAPNIETAISAVITTGIWKDLKDLDHQKIVDLLDDELVGVDEEDEDPDFAEIDEEEFETT